MGSILFGLLCHQPDIGNVSHGRGIIGSVFLAVFDDFLVHGCVATVRDQSQRVLKRAIRPPHFTPVTDHHRHRGVDDDVVRHMQVGDSFIRIDHRQFRTILVNALDVLPDLILLFLGKILDFRVYIPQTVVGIDSEFLKQLRVLFKQFTVVNGNRMAEKYRIGNLHHGRLQMKR